MVIIIIIIIIIITLGFLHRLSLKSKAIFIIVDLSLFVYKINVIPSLNL